ncbi:MAG: hypothetical protein M1837_002962 [Sclerophora amabilis]|nr:MAG: hypothetical protein M1837_002962 [Sclerophora amabilis]
MPTHRSINVALVSQFDLLTIPEYAPPAPPETLDPDFLTSPDPPSSVHQGHSLVSVYVPQYPCSQFWLQYSVSPPNPAGMHYYFKMFINGRHIVSWGVSKAHKYAGKTMFGLFDAGEDWMGVRKVEKRVMCFSGANTRGVGTSGSLEVRVFRAKGRKRCEPVLEELNGRRPGRRKADGSGDGVDLLRGGTLEPEDPQRYYRYALIDPLDQPFATFRYYFRSWDQLQALGIISPVQNEVASPILSLTQHSPSEPRSSSDWHSTSSSSSSTSANAISNNDDQLEANMVPPLTTTPTQSHPQALSSSPPSHFAQEPDSNLDDPLSFITHPSSGRPEESSPTPTRRQFVNPNQEVPTTTSPSVQSTGAANPSPLFASSSSSSSSPFSAIHRRFLSPSPTVRSRRRNVPNQDASYPDNSSVTEVETGLGPGMATGPRGRKAGSRMSMLRDVVANAMKRREVMGDP